MLYFVGKCDYLGERTPLLEHRNKAHYRAAEFVLRIESAKLGERLSLAFGIFAVVLNQSGGGSDTDEHGEESLTACLKECARQTVGFRKLARYIAADSRAGVSERGVAEAADKITHMVGHRDDIRAVFFRERRSAVVHCGLSTEADRRIGNRGADVFMPEIVPR